MDTDTKSEKDGGISRQDFDAAIGVSEQIEKQTSSMMASCITPLGLELQIVTMLIAFCYPAVWAVVVFFYVVVCVLGVKQNAVRECLKSQDIRGAKEVFDSAKAWHAVLIVTEFAMGVIEIWGLAQLFVRIGNIIKG